jgi:4-nitrophenyl phosphatase
MLKSVSMELNRLAEIQYFILDMDGTFYLGDHLLPGALEFIAVLEKRGTPYLFLTNNSSRHRGQYAEKIRRLGLVNLPDERIFTSGEATALFLKRERPGARLYVVGTPALESEFIQHGFELDEHHPEAVVLGFDTTLTYAKLWRLCDFVRAGLPYYATHPDINCPTENGFMPDIGAMIACVAASTGRQPDIIIGKPYVPIVDALVERTGLPADQMCMVGDRLYTDIALGAAGLRTVLVLSGETHLEDIPGARFQPDFVMDNLGKLAAALLSLT